MKDEIRVSLENYARWSLRNLEGADNEIKSELEKFLGSKIPSSYPDITSQIKDTLDIASNEGALASFQLETEQDKAEALQLIRNEASDYITHLNIKSYLANEMAHKKSFEDLLKSKDAKFLTETFSIPEDKITKHQADIDNLICELQKQSAIKQPAKTLTQITAALSQKQAELQKNHIQAPVDSKEQVQDNNSDWNLHETLLAKYKEALSLFNEVQVPELALEALEISIEERINFPIELYEHNQVQLGKDLLLKSQILFALEQFDQSIAILSKILSDTWIITSGETNLDCYLSRAKANAKQGKHNNAQEDLKAAETILDSQPNLTEKYAAEKKVIEGLMNSSAQNRFFKKQKTAAHQTLHQTTTTQTTHTTHTTHQSSTQNGQKM